MAAIQITVPVQILLRLMVTAQVSENVTLPSVQKPALADNQTTESRLLPSGYVAFPEYRLAYKLFRTAVSYNEAMSLCESEDGQLAVIDSVEKVGKIRSNFSSSYGAWIGLLPPHGTEGWTTVDGKSRNNLPWEFGPPIGSRRCACVEYRGLGFLDCQSERPYFCEIALPRI